MKRKKAAAGNAKKQIFSLHSVSGQKTGMKAFLVDWVFLWLYLAGLAVWLISTADLSVSIGLCLVLQGAVAGLMQLAFLGKRNARCVKVIIWCAALALVAVLGRDLWLSGIHTICNDVVDVIGTHFPYLLPAYSVTVAESMETAALYVGMIWLSALMALPGAYFIKAGNRSLFGIQVIGMLLVQMLTGIGPGKAEEVFFLFCMLAIWIRGHGEQVTEGRQRLALLQAFVLAAGGAFVLVFGMGLLFQRLSVGEEKLFTDWKADLKQAVEDVRYQGESTLLPEGQFTGLSSFEPKETPVLEVTMSQPESYYLRGYTGAVYTGTGWQDTENSLLWKNRDLFYWLHQEGFYGQEGLGDAALALGETSSSEEKNTITVKNLAGSAKYCYVPYELQSAAADSATEAQGQNEVRDMMDSQKIGDAGLLTKGLTGNRSYTYQALPNQVTKYPMYAAALLDEETLTEQEKSYQSLEEHYNEFVYSAYLNIPENLSATLYDLLGAKDIKEGEKHVDYAEAKQNILYVLTSDYKDTDKLKENWDGTDLVYDFLSFSKEGYSVHFASAAALMFRYYGIPSRYVEGYLITPQDAENMTAGEAYTLDETHAHAWVEYYQDGVGWLPFETTPSYLNIMKTADDYQDISGVSGGGYRDQQEEDQQEEPQEDETQEEDKGIDWLLVGMVLLVIGICLMVLAMISFLVWLLLQRRKTKKAKRLFESPDRRTAVRALYGYTMNLLSVAGLKIRNTSLYRYEKNINRMFDEEIGRQYHEVVSVRQEAVYSAHTITEEQWKSMKDFKDKVWDQIYINGDFIQKFQLKYIYFL